MTLPGIYINSIINKMRR